MSIASILFEEFEATNRILPKDSVKESMLPISYLRASKSIIFSLNFKIIDLLVPITIRPLISLSTDVNCT